MLVALDVDNGWLAIISISLGEDISESPVYSFCFHTASPGPIPNKALIARVTLVM